MITFLFHGLVWAYLFVVCYFCMQLVGELLEKEKKIGYPGDNKLKHLVYRTYNILVCVLLSLIWPIAIFIPIYEEYKKKKAWKVSKKKEKELKGFKE